MDDTTRSREVITSTGVKSASGAAQVRLVVALCEIVGARQQQFARP
jgi:hypothetical protein